MKDLDPEMGKFTITEDPSQDSECMVDITTLPNFPCNRSGNPREDINLAVSYTHLDVYKRQLLSCCKVAWLPNVSFMLKTFHIWLVMLC